MSELVRSSWRSVEFVQYPDQTPSSSLFIIILSLCPSSSIHSPPCLHAPHPVAQLPPPPPPQPARPLPPTHADQSLSQNPLGSSSQPAGHVVCEGLSRLGCLMNLQPLNPRHRVRCDLKDLAIPTSGPHPTCSNCKERGIKCVYASISLSVLEIPSPLSSFSDEFADVKAVKLLRRGRRLQQVE
jgi:Fungal Zn(2)-Cys(6) binuclear cluster domain